jgi:hypothetical protein
MTTNYELVVQKPNLGATSDKPPRFKSRFGCILLFHRIVCSCSYGYQIKKRKTLNKIRESFHLIQVQVNEYKSNTYTYENDGSIRIVFSSVILLVHLISSCCRSLICSFRYRQTTCFEVGLISIVEWQRWLETKTYRWVAGVCLNPWPKLRDYLGVCRRTGD